MKEVKICGVVLSSRKQRKETITGINWFDMEISEFVDNCEKEKYRESSAAKRKLCEIEGILKYLRPVVEICSGYSERVERSISWI